MRLFIITNKYRQTMNHYMTSCKITNDDHVLLIYPKDVKAKPYCSALRGHIDGKKIYVYKNNKLTTDQFDRFLRYLPVLTSLLCLNKYTSVYKDDQKMGTIKGLLNK